VPKSVNRAERIACDKRLESADGKAAVKHPVRRVRDDSTATAEGNTSKAEAHERHQHETRLEGPGTEEDVKRLKKPEGVAEPGGGSPGERNRRLRRNWQSLLQV